MVTGFEESCGSSASTTLRQPIVSSIDIVERSTRLDRANHLLVLRGSATKELLDSSFLIVGGIIELHQLLPQGVETEGEVIKVLTRLECQVLPLLAKCLQCGLAGAVAADACRSDGVPGLLGSLLLCERELHLGRDCSNEGVHRPSILIEIEVAVVDRLPQVPHLEPDPHDRGPLDIVGLGEGRPPTIPDDSLDSVMALAPVWGEGVTPPVRDALSVEPVVSSVTGHLSLQLSNPLPQPLGLQRVAIRCTSALECRRRALLRPVRRRHARLR
jgi:hypothetical protein